MHGAGNDYIYVDATQYHIADPSAAAIEWSHRHFGIGGDGLVLIDRPDAAVADFAMHLFNADGSEAAMCGNASRCVGRLVHELGMTRKQQLRLLTPSGVKMLHVEVDAQGRVESVTVDMLAPILADERQFTTTGEPLPDGCFVSMGNPLYVIFVDDIDAVDVASCGARLEHHPRFPQRCNIVFAQSIGSTLRIRVWEGLCRCGGGSANRQGTARLRRGHGRRHAACRMARERRPSHPRRAHHYRLYRRNRHTLT